jgi:phosphoglycolate phosphatase-like HAD superfamily hydrolase
MEFGRGLRRFRGCILLAGIVLASHALAQSDPLPSWNDGPAKQAILNLVKDTTTQGSPQFVDPAARIATFDQDGTTWVEQPAYSQLIFAFYRVGVLAAKDPRLKETEPFKTVLSGDRAAIAKLPLAALEKIFAVTHTGMTVEEFQTMVRDWIAKAQDPHFKHLYTDLVYQPMIEVMQYLRANGYKTYIVTGGGQDFVRAYSERVYGIPPEQVVGSTADVTFGYDKAGKAILTKVPQGIRIDDKTGKPIGIHLMIGRRPVAAFGNSDGDQQMLEYTQAGDGARLMMLVHHDDAAREYAYGPESNIGTFSDALMTEATAKGWTVISMKNDWKRVFSWEH